MKGRHLFARGARRLFCHYCRKHTIFFLDYRLERAVCRECGQQRQRFM